MNRKAFIDFIGWGILLWLIGYLLGIVFFMLIPHALIGWAIMPIGIVITLWILLKRIKSKKLNYYLSIAIFWTIIAILLDYLFIVKMLNPTEGYYKIDVYVYYFLTFAMPITVGLMKNKGNRINQKELEDGEEK